MVGGYKDHDWQNEIKMAGVTWTHDKDARYLDTHVYPLRLAALTPA